MNTFEIVQPIILEAGRLARDLFVSTFSCREKSRHELVCEADEQIDRLMRESLAKKFPEYGIFSEESMESKGNGKHRWITDPIDGTAYFACGIPYFSICLSLEVDGYIAEAFVFNPMSDEFYYGCADASIATLNNRTIQCSSVSSISDAKIGVGFSADKPQIDRYFADWGEMLGSCKKGIGLISPALNICNVARGRMDVFLDNGSSMEGHSGAALILKLAGGCTCNYNLTEWDHHTKGIIATNTPLGNSLLHYRRAQTEQTVCPI